MLCTLSFMALEGTLYGEKINVDIYIEGPGLSGRLNYAPEPVFDIGIGRVGRGYIFEIEGEDLDLSNRRLLKEGAEFEVKNQVGYNILPAIKFNVRPHNRETFVLHPCGPTGDNIKAYNDVGKPLKSLTLVTKMRIGKDPIGFITYINDCEVKTEYHE